MYIGIDIGGTKCAVVFGDENANIIDKIKFETRAFDETYKRILDALHVFGAGKAIGISCGGPLDSEKGIIMSPPNLPGWDNIHITEMLESAFGVPAYLKNDADAGALAEWMYGAGKGCDNMIFMTFGTGLGAGLILNGSLYSGFCGCAGEIGHVRLTGCGPVGYGKEGSCEGFCSGGGIAQLGQIHARALLQKGQVPSYCSSVAELDTVTAKGIAECAKAGYADAIYVYQRSGEMLGRTLAILIDILNPEMIVIGSIFARCENLLRKAMQRELEREGLSTAVRACRIVPAGLGERIGDIAAISVAVNGIGREVREGLL